VVPITERGELALGVAVAAESELELEADAVAVAEMGTDVLEMEAIAGCEEVASGR